MGRMALKRRRRRALDRSNQNPYKKRQHYGTYGPKKEKKESPRQKQPEPYKKRQHYRKGIDPSPHGKYGPRKEKKGEPDVLFGRLSLTLKEEQHYIKFIVHLVSLVYIYSPSTSAGSKVFLLVADALAAESGRGSGLVPS